MRWFLAFLLFSFASLSSAEESSITFISSSTDLTNALATSEDLKGIAISVPFYRAANPEEKMKIKNMVRQLRTARDRPIFLYGKPFDHRLAKKMLGKEDGTGCTPTSWAGIFPTSAKMTPDTVNMCAGDRNDRTEEGYREWISDYWVHIKTTSVMKGYIK